MKLFLRSKLILLLMLATLPAAVAQLPPGRPPARPVARPAPQVPEDVLKLKQLADGGNLQAYLALANKYCVYARYSDALDCYYKAAETGSLEAMYQAGHMLLTGVGSSEASQKVEPNPEEGIKWIFRAATNLYPAACLDMSLALQGGLAVRVNAAEAYAWMILYAEREPNRGPVALESLALRLKTQTLVEGKQLAAEYKKGHWPNMRFSNASFRVNLTFKLTGVTMGGRTPLAVINRRTLGVGETADVPLEGGGSIALKVLEIRAESVLVEISGEALPRWLYFDNSVATVKP